LPIAASGRTTGAMFSFALLAFSTIFAIVDPFAVIAPFLAMTAGDDGAKRRAIALRASIVAGGVLVLFAAAGALVFDVFGITMPAFRVAGGVLLFFTALDMLRARLPPSRATAAEAQEGREADDPAVIPLAMPLLAGPGAIASVVMLTGRASTMLEHASVYASIAATCLVTYLVLRASERVAKLLGTTGMNILTRLMGLMLAALAVQFVLDGLRTAFPSLGASG
jgi:multiple antibiotic resistance protein